MNTFYLIRHAYSDGNIYRRMHGQTNGKLAYTAKGQVEALTERFKDIYIDGIYSSDLYRAYATAIGIAKQKEMPIILDRECREQNLGFFEDVTYGLGSRSIYKDLFQDRHNHQYTFSKDNDESVRTAGLRLKTEMESIARQHPGKTFAVFSHGGAIAGFQTFLAGDTDQLYVSNGWCENTCISKYEYDGEWHQLMKNDAEHLSYDLRCRDRFVLQDGDVWFMKEKTTPNEWTIGIFRDDDKVGQYILDISRVSIDGNAAVSDIELEKKYANYLGHIQVYGDAISKSKMANAKGLITDNKLNSEISDYLSNVPDFAINGRKYKLTNVVAESLEELMR